MTCVLVSEASVLNESISIGEVAEGRGKLILLKSSPRQSFGLSLQSTTEDCFAECWTNRSSPGALSQVAILDMFASVCTSQKLFDIPWYSITHAHTSTHENIHVDIYVCMCLLITDHRGVWFYMITHDHRGASFSGGKLACKQLISDRAYQIMTASNNKCWCVSQNTSEYRWRRDNTN